MIRISSRGEIKGGWYRDFKSPLSQNGGDNMEIPKWIKQLVNNHSDLTARLIEGQWQFTVGTEEFSVPDNVLKEAEGLEFLDKHPMPPRKWRGWIAQPNKRF